jgi:hypothetical protein
VPTGDHDYQRMITALVDVTRRRDRELENAEQAYQDSAARAAAELTAAENEAVAADRRAASATGQVLEVDREADRLWDRLRRARGLRIRALGELPDPTPMETLPRVALPRSPDSGMTTSGRESAHELLARAAARIEDAVRPASRRPLPGWALALLPLLGALAAAATGLVGAGLVAFGGTPVPGGVVIRGLGWLAFLAAPSAGAPVAATLSHRCLKARLDIGGIGLTLLGGMVAAALLSLTFASAH